MHIAFALNPLYKLGLGKVGQSGIEYLPSMLETLGLAEKMLS